MGTPLRSYYGPLGGFNTGRGSTQDMLDKLAADKAAANQYNAGVAAQRGEVYSEIPDAIHNPYGGGVGGGSYGSGGSGVGGSFGMAAGNNVVTSPGGGGGNINLSRGSYEDQQMLMLRDKLGKENFEARLKALQGAGVGSIQPRVGGGNIAANEEAARAAAFARAKDRAGQTALASLTALQNVLNNRGMFGSTEEARLTQAGLQGGANVINEFARDELMTDLNRAAQISDRNYAGDVTQRGQDAAAKQSLLALINSAGTVY